MALPLPEGKRGVLIYWTVEVGGAMAVHSQLISCSASEVHAMVEGAMRHGTDMEIEQNFVDSHGVVRELRAIQPRRPAAVPRIRDLGKITLYRTGPRADFAARYPSAGHLLTRRLNGELITSMWDDLLRVAASVKGGHASAALVVGKICSSKRQQNALASAIKEYGALRRTVYARYLADETYRRRIGRQLNKGENVHAPTPGKGRCAAGTTRSRPSRCGA